MSTLVSILVQHSSQHGGTCLDSLSLFLPTNEMSPQHRRRLSWSCLCGGIRRVKNFLFWTTTQSESKTLVFHGNPEPGTAAVRLLCSTLVSAAAIHSQTNISDFLAFRFSDPTRQRRPQRIQKCQDSTLKWLLRGHMASTPS